MDYKKKYKITINLETDNYDYCSCYGKQYLTDDICEFLGCSENDIEIEEKKEVKSRNSAKVKTQGLHKRMGAEFPNKI